MKYIKTPNNLYIACTLGNKKNTLYYIKGYRLILNKVFL